MNKEENPSSQLGGERYTEQHVIQVKRFLHMHEARSLLMASRAIQLGAGYCSALESDDGHTEIAY